MRTPGVSVFMIAWVGLLYTPCLAGAESAPPDFPEVAALPDPFLFTNGSRVESVAEWPSRRAEMIDLILRYEYGQVPDPPDNLSAVSSADAEILHEGATSHRTLRLQFGPDKQLALNVHLYLPTASPGPYPAIVRIGRGCPIIEEVNQRGFVFADFDHKELEPDTEGHDVVGPAQSAYLDHDWASLAVWAWGASRVLDYLMTLPEVDAKKVLVTGHSRTGKAALLAGALDERFAMVVPNGSGCGGASAYRVASPVSESLELITRETRFASWFLKDFRQFAGHETRLPFDQHFLKALVAPRVLLTTEALEDDWANPLGNQASWQGAQPVFNFLGAAQNNLMHYRSGKHDQLAEDFRVMLDVAEAHFGGTPLPAGLEHFNNLRLRSNAEKILGHLWR